LSKSFRILALNPGSTSTKVALFENKKELFMTSISHNEEALENFESISDQHEFRTKIIESLLEQNGIDLNTIDTVVGRGGLIHPIPSGTYRVNRKMLEDLKKAERGEHASNLGGIIACDIAEKHRVPAFIVDPVVVDEMDPVARISGMPEIERRSIFHALNQKAVARKAALELGALYDEINLIVAHMGGGISVGAHCKGRVIDVNNAFDGDGPFAPERAGGLPAGQLVDLCFSPDGRKETIRKCLVGRAGMVAYLGTNDMRSIEDETRDPKSPKGALYYAMAYQVAKEIGVCATVLKGSVEAIVLTGGIAYDDLFVQWIKERTEWIARIIVYAGQEEMRALALGALRILRGDEKVKIYK